MRTENVSNLVASSLCRYLFALQGSEGNGFVASDVHSFQQSLY